MSITPILPRSIEPIESNVINIQRKDLSFKSLAGTNSTAPQYLDANIYRAQALFALPKCRISFCGAPTPNRFAKVATNELHPLWQKLIERGGPVSKKEEDFRSVFARDSDRILNTKAYSRMRGKAQVFIDPQVDTTCTRMEHVLQVTKLARQISRFMGLNEDLTEAIAMGHDIGHTPFGHAGERALNDIMKSHNIKGNFWHAKNGLRFVDDIETVTNHNGVQRNLNLTYAVRDGMFCHSFSSTYTTAGNAKAIGLKPRSEFIDLKSVDKYSGLHPITWEGCVVKMADDISQLGRDIEDAITNGVLENATEKKNALIEEIRVATGEKFGDINQSSLLTRLTNDLLTHSNPEDGLMFSENGAKIIKLVEQFIHKNIHNIHDSKQNPEIEHSLSVLFNELFSMYDGENTINKLRAARRKNSELMSGFKDWLARTTATADPKYRKDQKLENHIVYDMSKPEDYKLAIIEFLSSLSDRTAIEAFKNTVYR